MITPLSFNSLQSFQGTKPQNTRPQSTRPQNTKSQGQEKDPNDILKAAALIGMLIAGGAGINCVSQIANTPKKPVEPSTTSIGQVQEREKKWKEEGKKVAASEVASEQAEHESMRQAYQDAQYENAIAEQDAKEMIGAKLNLEDDDVLSAYNKTAAVSKKLGSNGVEAILKASEKYSKIYNNVNPYDFLALVVQQGGVPKLSKLALEDVKEECKDKGIDLPDSDTDKAFLYFAIRLNGAAEGDVDKAVLLFTGQYDDTDKIIGEYHTIRQVINDIDGSLSALANNDPAEAHQALYGED